MNVNSRDTTLVIPSLFRGFIQENKLVSMFRSETVSFLSDHIPSITEQTLRWNTASYKGENSLHKSAH